MRTSSLKRKLDAHMVQLNEAQDEIMKKKELLEGLLHFYNYVIRALDPKLNPATAEIQALKSLVLDRDRRILTLEV
ncbi:unnamed protein product [Arctogadus glacialis]